MENMRHGGEIYGKNIRCDFSVNINPLGLPQAVKKALLEGMEELEHYPDRDCGMLRQALSRKEHVPAEWILCGNGASELFQLITAAVRPERALVTAPAFSGYETALAGAGVKPEYLFLPKEQGFSLTESLFESLEKGPELTFLCNPNNPVGNCAEPQLLDRAAQFCREHRQYLVVDECFLGFLEDAGERSMKPFLQENPYLIIVSAFTKLYAMPGLRLGYLFCSNQELMREMKRRQTEWSVSVPAQQAGIAALMQQAYVEEARKLIREEGRFLTASLEELGFRVYPSQADYLLFETQEQIFDGLLQRGILIRHCDNYHGLDGNFYRIAIRKHEDNSFLVEQLRQVTRQQKQQ